tara:strand:+ start:10524 stop:12335 length:1812 start_codon:yes stop_codon:yes gene_type:complete
MATPSTRLGKNQLLSFGLLSASAFLAILFGFLVFSDETAITIYRKVTVPTLGLLLLLFFWTLGNLFRENSAFLRKAYGRKLAWIGIPVCSLLFLSNQPPEFKLVMDELILASNAKSIHQFGQPMTPTKALHIGDRLTHFDAHIDKRPALYPLLVASVHHLTGYRVSNAFYVNMALVVVCFALLYGLGYYYWGVLGAVGGMLSLLFIPLLAYYGTGANLEILNFTLLLILFLSVAYFLEKGDRPSLGLVIITGTLVCYGRYESPLFLLPVGFCIVYHWVQRREISIPWQAYIAPLLLIPIPLQNAVFKSSETNWQLFSKPGVQEPFSLSFIPENLAHAVHFFFSPNPNLPNGIILTSVGLIGLLLALITAIGRWRDVPCDKFARALFILFLGGFAHFFLMMSYFWGQFDEPIIQRLALPYFLFFALGSLFLICRIFHNRSTRARWGLGGAVALLWITFTGPAIAYRSPVDVYISPKNFNWAMDYIEEHPNERYAVISSAPMFWIANNIASFSINYANAAPFELKELMNRGVYDDIYFFQEIIFSPDDNKWIPGPFHHISAAYEIEVEKEVRFGEFYGVRLMRITAIDAENPHEVSQPVAVPASE